MNKPAWFFGDVSRETMDRLDQFAALVQKWSPRINLVSKADLPNLFDRHIWDSAQVFVPESGNWLDFGSGGGFPGIVVAIFAAESGSQVTLVESDQRKCAFLRTAQSELGLKNVQILAQRIEDHRGQYSTISARAVASVTTLLDLSVHCSAPETVFLFPKGERWKEEIEIAAHSWHFELKAKPSHTNNEAAILELRHVSRK